jgi:hypothetical protein
MVRCVGGEKDPRCHRSGFQKKKKRQYQDRKRTKTQQQLARVVGNNKVAQENNGGRIRFTCECVWDMQ